MTSYYNIPEEYSDEGYIFNPSTWVSPEDVASGSTTIVADGSSTSGNYVSKSGDTMTGALSVPSVTANQISFLDGTTQYTAADTNSIASTAQKTTAITYDASLNITDIGNYTCSNYNVSALTGITGNLQTRISNLETKTTNQSYVSSTQTNFANNVYISTLTAGNFNTSHLSGTTSNIQAQLNQIGATGYYFYTSSSSVTPPSTAKYAIITCVGGGGGGGSAPCRNDSTGVLRGGAGGGSGGVSQTKIALTSGSTLTINVGSGGRGGVFGWYSYEDCKKIKSYSLAQSDLPQELTTLLVTHGEDGGDTFVLYNGFYVSYASGGKGGQSDSNFSSSGNKAGGLGGTGNIADGKQGGYGAGSSSGGAGGSSADGTDVCFTGGAGGGCVTNFFSTINIYNGGNSGGFKPADCPSSIPYQGGAIGGGAAVISSGSVPTIDSNGQQGNYILCYASTGGSGGGSQRNAFGGDGGSGCFGSGGGGAAAGWYSVTGSYNGYKANKLGGDGGGGYVVIQYLF